MSFNFLNRRIHYWAAAFVLIPAAIIFSTGILLQLKKNWSWVQPTEQRGTGTVPEISLEQILTAVSNEPALNVKSWDDVNRLDVRPGRGIVKVWLNSGWEVQVDLGTGAVLQSAYRRSDVIESIHDGSFFAGGWTKLGIFLPTGLTLLVMLLTGVWMLWLPFSVRRKRKRLNMSKVPAICALLLTPTLAFAQSPQDQQFAADVDAFVTRMMALDVTPGLAIAVVKGDQPVLMKGYGWADVERKVPATENTAFYIASMTKAFTALDVALLAQQGRLSLDAPVSRYLGGVTWGTGVNADSITIRQLLSHTHGINNDGPVVFRTAFSGDHTNALLKDLLRYHTASSAGHSYRYTNLGYNIAGIIVDELTKSKWQDQLAANLFKPLGMSSTTAYISRLDSARLAMPYAPLTKRVHYGKADSNMQAAGGLVSTATDMARWLEAQINLGRIDGKQIFPRAVMAETHRIQAPITTTNAAGNIGYTLGWNVSVVNGDTVLHHGGGFSTFGSYMAFSPMSEVGVAIMVNSSALGGRAMNLIVDYVLDRGAEAEGWRDKYEQRLADFAGRLPQAREQILADRARRAERPQTLPLPLETYAGTYDNPEGGTMIWTVRDGRLWVQIGVLKSIADVFDSATSKLRAELEPGVGEVIAFNIENGRAVSLKYSDRIYVLRR